MSADKTPGDEADSPVHRYFYFPGPGEGLAPYEATPTQIFLPVSTMYCNVVDNGGDVIALCFTPELAERVAHLLNNDAALAFGKRDPA